MKTCSNKNCEAQNPQPLSNFHKCANKKDGLRSRCKACENKKAAEYREKNRQLLAEKQRLYYQNNPEIQQAASRNWKKKNKERNKDYMARWHQKNKVYRSKYNRRYAQENPDGVLERSRKRRAVAKGLTEFFTEEEYREKFERLGRKCFYCKKSISIKESHRDHYIALSKGGSDKIENIVPACSRCNEIKWNHDAEKFILMLGNHEPSRTNGNKVVRKVQRLTGEEPNQ